MNIGLYKITTLKVFKELSIKEKLFLVILLLDFLLLISLGKDYTKLQVIFHLHLHDLVVISLFIFTLFFKRKAGILYVNILIFISFIYLFVSIFVSKFDDTSWYYIFRQYMIYGYILISYFIVRTLLSFSQGARILYGIIIFSGLFAFSLQLLYVLNLLIFEDIIPIGRYALSPVMTYGFVIASAASLVYVKRYLKHFLFGVSFLLALTIGQDSSYLSLIIIYVLYWFVKSNTTTKIILSILLLLLILFLFLIIPTFSDVNVIWRLYYWKATFIDLLNQKRLIFGKGFGIPYLSEDTRVALNNIMTSRGYNAVVDNNMIYETSPHNSFITMIYHLGFFNFLIFLPLIEKLKRIKTIKNNQSNLLLFLVFIGLSVWSFFNLILELPHSASIYWIVFFALIYHTNDSVKD